MRSSAPHWLVRSVASLTERSNAINFNETLFIDLLQFI
jgi:hypothetical protein